MVPALRTCGGENPYETIAEQSPHIHDTSTSSSRLGVLVTIWTFSPEAPSTCKKVADVATKLALSGLCFTASLGGVEPSRRNFSSPFWQNVFGYGDAFAWGTFSTYCIFKIHNYMIRAHPPFPKQEGSQECSPIFYWGLVFALGLMTEIPTAYTTWYYNQNSPFLYVYVPTIDSFFSALSVHELFQLLSHLTQKHKNCLTYLGLQR
jgi:hypothetical protein